MLRPITLFFLVALSLICLPLCALADDKPDYGRAGFYLGGGMSVGTNTGLADQWVNDLSIWLTAQRNSPTDFRVDSAVGVNARVGYRIIPWLAVEGQVEWLPGFDVKYFNDQTIFDGDTLNASINAKAYVLPKERFQPFLLLGAGYLWNQSKRQPAYDVVVLLSGPDQGVTVTPVVTWTGTQTEDSFAGRFGGGIDMHFTEHVLASLDVAYVLPTGSAMQFQYVSVGINLYYRF